MNSILQSTLLAIGATIYPLYAAAMEPPAGLGANAPTKEVLEADKDPVIRKLYADHCAVCHDNPGGRTPPRLRFVAMSPHTIYRSITKGSMRAHAWSMTDEQKRKLAVALAYQEFKDDLETSQSNLCTDKPGPIDLKAPQWNGWGNSPENYRYQPSPGISAPDVPRLKVKWAFAYPKFAGKANGQPTVIGDRLYVTSEAGAVYSLNAKTGCNYWTHITEAGVRTAVVVGPVPRSSKARVAAYFGDGSGHVYAVNAETGERLWKTFVDTHMLARLVGAPMLHKGRLYIPVSGIEEITPIEPKYPCCTFRGSVVALNAVTGEKLWQGYVLPEAKPFKINSIGNQMYGPAGAAIWSTPTLDLKRRTVYVGTGNSYTDVVAKGYDAIVAIDSKKGAIKWIQQFKPDDTYLMGCAYWEAGGPNCPSKFGGDWDFGASPILQTLPDGKQLVIVGGKNGRVTALNPDSGAVVWDTVVSQGSVLGGIQYGMASDGKYVYAAAADHIRPTGNKPGITALDISTGKVVWHTPAPAISCTMGEIDGGGTRYGCALGQSAAVTVIPGAVFSGSLNARLRAYDTETGKIIWDYAANTDYKTVNGVAARGGAFDSGGPTIVDGMLYVNSGYGSTLDSGNVLLAFTVDGK